MSLNQITDCADRFAHAQHASLTPPDSSWRIDSSSIIAHPVNFYIYRERSLKCDAKNSTYIYIYICVCIYVYIYITLSIINLRLHHFSQFLFNVKKMVFKIFKSWQIYDWLAKRCNPAGLYGSKASDGCSAFQGRSKFTAYCIKYTCN